MINFIEGPKRHPQRSEGSKAKSQSFGATIPQHGLVSAASRSGSIAPLRVYVRIFCLFLTITLLFNINNSFAAKSRQSSVRTFGDYMQVINPVFVAGLASQEKGFGHFAFIYSQTWVIMHGTKLVARSGKWQVSKRPHIDGKKDRYEGLPSGHTASAWVAASYVRTFSEDYKAFSIPLYITAAITGYSRVKSKEHTSSQVLAGAALAEAVTFVNSKLEWSNEYRSTNFSLGPDGGMVSFQFRF